MHAVAISPRGGVAPKTTRFRGQSIVEYVLIIAVIGLVIVFAGPGVAGAIRNQFNLVGNTLNSGTNGGTEGDGSAGADSATVQAAGAKDAKDWSPGEQEAVAEDIAAKGEASSAYAKARAAMDAGTKFSVKLTNGQTLEYRIIGINHDDLADGSGKAGLTFLTTSAGIKSRMNAKNTSYRGWEGSELRKKMNSGEIWNLMPADFQSKVKSVTKVSFNNRGVPNPPCAVTAASDKLFLLSYSEIDDTLPKSLSDWSWLGMEGTQYEAFRGKVLDHDYGNPCLSNGCYWWERSPYPTQFEQFLFVGPSGCHTLCDYASEQHCICPAWCF